MNHRNTDGHAPTRPGEPIAGVPVSSSSAEDDTNGQRPKPNRKRSTLVFGIAGLALLCGVGASALLPRVIVGVEPESAASTKQPVPPPTATSRPTPTMRLTEFTDPIHGFTVKFLSPPTHTKVAVFLTAKMPITVDVFTDEYSGQTVMAYPLSCMDPAHTTEVLRSFVKTRVNNSGKSSSAPPAVQSQNLTTVQSFPAIRSKFTYTDSDDRRLTSQTVTVMHGSTVIESIALSGSSPDPFLDAAHKAFIESLRFLDKAAPSAPMCTGSSQLPGVSAG